MKPLLCDSEDTKLWRSLWLIQIAENYPAVKIHCGRWHCPLFFFAVHLSEKEKEATHRPTKYKVPFLFYNHSVDTPLDEKDAHDPGACSSVTFYKGKTRLIMCKHILSGICSAQHIGIMAAYYSVSQPILQDLVYNPLSIWPWRSLRPTSSKSHQHNAPGGCGWSRLATEAGAQPVHTGS